MVTTSVNATVGVLALQGDVHEHLRILKTLRVNALEVRKVEDLKVIDGLIIPGGESSVIDKLSRIFGLQEPIKRLIASDFPVFGTCAGMIMLADDVDGAIAGQQNFGGIRMTVQRNAFGPQTESFETKLHVPKISADPMSAAFIRAPIVIRTGPQVEVLCTLANGRVVAVQQGNLLATSFHPETTGETCVHRHFLNVISSRTVN